MKRVTRQEILDYVTYEEQRKQIRKKIMKIKELRRINVAGVLSFLFENTDTVRYQIQEMIRVERIVKETDILHEIKTYNELLGDSGELGCTLLIEIDDPDEREEKLTQWLELPSIYILAWRMKVESGLVLTRGKLEMPDYLLFSTLSSIPEVKHRLQLVQIYHC